MCLRKILAPGTQRISNATRVLPVRSLTQSKGFLELNKAQARPEAHKGRLFFCAPAARLLIQLANTRSRLLLAGGRPFHLQSRPPINSDLILVFNLLNPPFGPVAHTRLLSRQHKSERTRAVGRGEKFVLALAAGWEIASLFDRKGLKCTNTRRKKGDGWSPGRMDGWMLRRNSLSLLCCLLLSFF